VLLLLPVLPLVVVGLRLMMIPCCFAVFDDAVMLPM
jgi:hypothetical protein